ncbi:MAG: phosphoribosyltransferase family protein [Spirulinaceae cyanobacterium]
MYHNLIETLAVKIHRDRWHFEQIVCLARGGLRVGDLLSRIYDKPLAILFASSYGGCNNKVRGQLAFSKHLAMTTPSVGSKVLLVDDLVDSGYSLAEGVNWLKEHYSDDIEEIRTAVIWHKACSIFVPDYCVNYLSDNPWIRQPFEYYEQITLNGLEQKYEFL